MDNLRPLFNLTFPRSDICKEQELYFRCHGGVTFSQAENTLTFPQGGVVTFDTYFNCFSYSKYIRYTTADNLIAKLLLSGRLAVRLKARQTEGEETLLEQVFESAEKKEFLLEYNFTQVKAEGLFYLEIEALSTDATLYGGGYFTKSAYAAEMSKIAVIICTYNRQEYVYKSMTALDCFFKKMPELKDSLSVFVVDNAHTIERDKLPQNFVTLFENKNCGGSGGFTRGMMEAYFRKEEFSHVLFMDDDVIFDPETIYKTINLLALRKPEYTELCIGGAMLEIERPYFQYEAAGIWTGRKIKKVNNGLDLRLAENVFKNEKPFQADYNAWWFMCMPLGLADKYGFPFPFFIKGDDIEYSLRCRADIAFLNGISVWHMAFENKELGHFEYYIKRNEAIINALYKKNVFKEIYKLFLYTGRKIIRRKYTSAGLGFMAYNDFLKGADFFLSTDAEQLNTRLKEYYCSRPKKRFIGNSLLFIGMAFKLLFRYRRVAKDYKKRLKDVTSIEFWQKYLDIE